MKRKCMFCDKKATMFVKQFVNLKMHEVQLCERCARERNLLPDPPSPQIDLKALMNLLIPPIHVPVGEGTTATEPQCPKCGLNYASFKAEGRLGCGHDYETFRSILEPILERVHRSVVHTGKHPATAQLAARIEELRTQMNAAVAVEDYEQAARLRDLIRQQEAQGTPG
jgi:protein arginine kinase activator